MYKMIACDIDETLLNDQGVIPERNIEAIRKARMRGVRFVPATGRGYYSVYACLKALGLLEEAGEYVISYNGGIITENRGDRLLHFEGITFELAEELFRRGLKYDVCIHIYTRDGIYAYRLNQEEKDYTAGRLEMEEFFEPDIGFLAGEQIGKVIYVNPDYAYLKKIEGELEDLARDVEISYSANRYMEFNKKGVNKGAGLLSLAELLGIRPQETIAIGDNFNDLSMIQAAGLGAGVRNAAEGIKPLCGYVTEATNNEGAVAEVIEKFILG